MNRLKVPEVECLHCRIKGSCVTDSDYIKTVDDIIVRPIICTRCGKGWKDFYGAHNEHSVLLQVQRNTNNNSDRSSSGESESTLQ